MQSFGRQFHGNGSVMMCIVTIIVGLILTTLKFVKVLHTYTILGYCLVMFGEGVLYHWLLKIWKTSTIQDGLVTSTRWTTITFFSSTISIVNAILVVVLLVIMRARMCVCVCYLNFFC